MITETHFTPNTNFKLHKFTTHVTNHPDKTAHAGTATVVYSRIRHCLLSPFQEHAIQATNIISQYLTAVDGGFNPYATAPGNVNNKKIIQKKKTMPHVRAPHNYS
jgi:hypothetical protein